MPHEHQAQRPNRRRFIWILGVITVLAVGGGLGYWFFVRGLVVGALPALTGEHLPLNEIHLPRGFRISVYAENVEGARSMARAANGVIYVGSREPGNVYALLDRDGDQRAEEVVTVLRGLQSPNGVAIHDGALYVAEISRVTRYDDIASTFRRDPSSHIVNASFPTDAMHGWKFIAFGPDGKLYVPVGCPCNVCQRSDPRYSSITRMNADGSGLEVFAQGVRNTVGFDWQPGTNVLWFTENGRDQMGDELPPDELDRAPTAGMHFGFPYCHAANIPDPEHNQGRNCQEFVPPVTTLGPHVAALGMRFYSGDRFPARYRGGIFVAQHGSWNRSEPIGYRVVFIPIEGDRAGKVEIFAEGWLSSTSAWGRPVDVLVMPDGALLVSDDKANAIYRVDYSGSRS